MNLKHIYILILLILLPKVNAAEKIFLYKGTLSREIKIDELYKFKKYQVPSTKLKNIIKITNQKEKNLYNILSYELDVPLKTSSKLLNSKIGEVFLGRISEIIYPNKILNKDIGIKSLRSAIILSSYKNNERTNLIDFLKAYPNKNIAIDLNALSKTLKKAESLKELINFYSNSPFKKLKDGSSRI
tara:strand:+ start:455 stop:1012 length:558 start_codon:yes stop_codon:yes gene_type:complete